jgi:predicted  nucleic acid-binding Zn-ribbon protein
MTDTHENEIKEARRRNNQLVGDLQGIQEETAVLTAEIEGARNHNNQLSTQLQEG